MLTAKVPCSISGGRSCFCVITMVAMWLIIATKYEMPVSTTHSCVGGMVGMAVAARGSDAVYWAKESSKFPFVSGFTGIIISWFLSPIASGILACFFFYVIRRFILRSPKPFDRAPRRRSPVLVLACADEVPLLTLKFLVTSRRVRRAAGWLQAAGQQSVSQCHWMCHSSHSHHSSVLQSVSHCPPALHHMCSMPSY